jgi:2-hydroxychromene-2-carboxylate isomerase
MAVVSFYYSLGSRYSYLASTQIEALERETRCRVEWQPIDSVALLKRRERNPFSGGAPVSGQYDWTYRELDSRRWAALYKVPFVEPRGRVEFDSRLLALAAVAAKRLGHGEAYSRALFAAMFAEPSMTRIDRDECVRRAEACSIARSQFESEMDSETTAAELRAAVDVAEQQGVFGVPTFVVGSDLFWGNDRLVLLRHRLLRRHS